MCDAKLKGTKKQKTWVDERDNNLKNRERGKWCLKKQINVCCWLYRYSEVVVSQLIYGRLSRQMQGHQRVLGTLKRKNKSHIFFRRCSQCSIPEKMSSTDYVSLLFVFFWILLLLLLLLFVSKKRRKFHYFGIFSLFSGSWLTFPIGV
jgi:hypothetical protein